MSERIRENRAASRLLQLLYDMEVLVSQIFHSVFSLYGSWPLDMTVMCSFLNDHARAVNWLRTKRETINGKR